MRDSVSKHSRRFDPEIKTDINFDELAAQCGRVDGISSITLSREYVGCRFLKSGIQIYLAREHALI